MIIILVDKVIDKAIRNYKTVYTKDLMEITTEYSQKSITVINFWNMNLYIY
jgi:hypothetical protein